jgi:hypothetical protein
VISVFRRQVDEDCALLGYYAASSGTSLPTFRDNVSVPPSEIKKSNFLEDGNDRFPETSVKNYHYKPRNSPEEHSSLVSNLGAIFICVQFYMNVNSTSRTVCKSTDLCNCVHLQYKSACLYKMTFLYVLWTSCISYTKTPILIQGLCIISSSIRQRNLILIWITFKSEVQPSNNGVTFVSGSPISDFRVALALSKLTTFNYFLTF